MAKSREKRGLGRGLSALMADMEGPNLPEVDETPETTQRRQPEQSIPIEQIRANPEQPRRTFNEITLQELAASISEKGIIQPLILRPDPDQLGKYQIVAGERRWRAAQLAQLHEVPAIVRDFDDTEVLEVAIIENIQRSDLNPLEEAQGYRQLIDRFGHTQEQLAQAMGKSRSHLANTMRLLQLPAEIQTFVQNGELSAGHARALLTADDPIALARKAVAQGMSVREIEKAAKVKSKPRNAPSSRPEKDADTRAIESELAAALGMLVSIDHDIQGGGGRLSIKYKDLNQLDDFLRLIHSPG